MRVIESCWHSRTQMIVIAPQMFLIYHSVLFWHEVYHIFTPTSVHRLDWQGSNTIIVPIEHNSIWTASFLVWTRMCGLGLTISSLWFDVTQTFTKWSYTNYKKNILMKSQLDCHLHIFLVFVETTLLFIKVCNQHYILSFQHLSNTLIQSDLQNCIHTSNQYHIIVCFCYIVLL